MQIIVVIFNVTLACCCLAVARWIWLFRRSLKRSTQILVMAEIMAHETLQDAPEQIQQGQFNLQQWNQFLSQLDPAIAQGKAILGWLTLSQTIAKIVLGRRWSLNPFRS